MFECDCKVRETPLQLSIGYNLASLSANIYGLLQISNSPLLSVHSTELNAKISETSRLVKEDLVVLNTVAHLLKGMDRLIKIGYVSCPEVSISNKPSVIAQLRRLFQASVFSHINGLSHNFDCFVKVFDIAEYIESVT